MKMIIIPASPAETEKAYEPPVVEIIEIRVEQGFQVSGDGTDSMGEPIDDGSW